MKSIRRLYFYLVTLVSLEIILWGLISLTRSMINRQIVSGVETLAQALALILVGVPVFMFHWLWSQRAARTDEEERSALLRAIFLYGTLLITLIPAVQNGLALINRLLLASSGMNTYRAIVGGTQSWSDNLIAILFNLVAAGYFYTILAQDWKSIKETENHSNIRRIYRYIWLVYSLVLMIFGVQQIIRFIFYVPSTILGQLGRETFVNGLALLVIATPIWVTTWKICQDALGDPEETHSLLRLGVLYVLALAGVLTTLASAGIIVTTILNIALGEHMSLPGFIQEVSGPISLLVPMAALWAYYGYWLNHDIRSVTDATRRAALKRLYFYILSLIGLTASFIGLAMLVAVIVDQLTGSAFWGDSMRGQTAAAIATLLAGLPLWFLTWRPMQVEALSKNDLGDHARRSLVRRSYLYFVIFVAVLGLMGSAIALMYNLLTFALGSRNENIASNLLNSIQLLVLFGGLLLYHFSTLRQDNALAVATLNSRQARFGVMVFEPGNPALVEALTAAVKKSSPGIPLVFLTVGDPIPEEARDAQAVVLTTALALNPPEALRLWLESYEGEKIVLASEAPGWILSGQPQRSLNASTQQAAAVLRQLAEGQEVRPASVSSAGMIVLYIVAVFFGLQIVFFLITLLLSAFIG